VGDRFIKFQGFVLIPILAIILAIAVVLTRRPFLQQITVLVIGAFIIALPNVVATLRWGRYLLRRQE
jgi:hypothetical protein